jgi:hypothetical protein
MSSHSGSPETSEATVSVGRCEPLQQALTRKRRQHVLHLAPGASHSKRVHLLSLVGPNQCPAVLPGAAHRLARRSCHGVSCAAQEETAHTADTASPAACADEEECQSRLKPGAEHGMPPLDLTPVTERSPLAGRSMWQSRQATRAGGDACPRSSLELAAVCISQAAPVSTQVWPLQTQPHLASFLLSSDDAHAAEVQAAMHAAHQVVMSGACCCDTRRLHAGARHLLLSSRPRVLHAAWRPGCGRVMLGEQCVELRPHTLRLPGWRGSMRHVQHVLCQTVNCHAVSSAYCQRRLAVC